MLPEMEYGGFLKGSIRKDNPEGSAFILLTFKCDASFQKVDIFLNNMKSQARSFKVCGIAGPIESSENMFMLIGGYANTSV